MGFAPDIHVMPVGNAGNIAAYWKGFCEYRDRGRADSAPALWGFQAEGAAPIVRGHVVERPETAASAIRIGNPASWMLAEAARDDSGGVIEAVSDDAILAAQRELALRDGIFVEPASAAGVAGLCDRAARGAIDSGLTVSVTLTGHGLKDIETALAHRGAGDDIVVDADVGPVAAAAGLADG
jgi:threonine synthase